MATLGDPYCPEHGWSCMCMMIRNRIYDQLVFDGPPPERLKIDIVKEWSRPVEIPSVVLDAARLGLR